MNAVFLVHVTGTTPHAIDCWRGPYKGLATAKAQATRMTRNWRGEQHGDHAAQILLLDPTALTLEAVQL